MVAKFILYKKIIKEQIKTLENLGLKISYSYKTNKEVGNLIQEMLETQNIDFSIHAKEEIDMIRNKSKIWFFTQAESEEELKDIIKKGIRNFVVDNETDLNRILNVIKEIQLKINLSLRMKFQEHRIGTGKYFVYGMSSKKINEIIESIRSNEFIVKLGVHIHRKSQNTSEWEIKQEIIDSLSGGSLKRLNFINLGGGLPSEYRSYTSQVLPYIFKKIKEARDFLFNSGIETYIEPGRFIAAPAIELETEVIQVQGKNLIINTTIYNSALDTLIGGHKMLIKGELSEKENGEEYLIKGNSPTRDDIFRYRVKLKNPRVGNKITFLNAGAYNYTTDFFGYKKLATEVVD